MHHIQSVLAVLVLFSVCCFVFLNVAVLYLPVLFLPFLLRSPAANIAFC